MLGFNLLVIFLKNQLNTILKTKKIIQEVEAGVWMPFNHKIKVKVDFMGVETDIQYLANIKEINVELDSTVHRKIKDQLALNAPHKYGNDSLEQAEH
ncbi:MAG: hypothetical protein R6V14_01290, partial [Halanaerobiales bacterium]